ncbi:mucin-3A isoform X2 [Xenopus laevis]|uniref:Mucin-3A isoform X2 n=1 Tax=Xenopus laevis TaxID=8355 RepID=A0A8J1MMK2_XENLA|nr:mucin-3A isoform X2 [Xenopus laevis]
MGYRELLAWVVINACGLRIADKLNAMLDSCWKCVKQQANRWTVSGDRSRTCYLFRSLWWQCQFLLVFFLIVSSWAYKTRTPKSSLCYKMGNGRALLQMPAKLLLADEAQFYKNALSKPALNGKLRSIWTLFMNHKCKSPKISVNNQFPSASYTFPLANLIQYRGKRRFMRQIDSANSTPAPQKDSQSAINAMVDKIIGRKESSVPLTGGQKIVASDTDFVLGASEWQLGSLENINWLQKESYVFSDALFNDLSTDEEKPFATGTTGNQPLPLENEVRDTTTLSSLRMQSVLHSDATSVTVAVTEKDAETVAVTGKDAETVAVTGKDAETVAVTGKDAETVAVTGKDAETVAVTPKDAETVAVTGKDAETVAVTPKDAESVAVTPKDAETVAVTPKDAETVAVTPKDAETVAVKPKDAETVAVTPKDAETVAVTPKDAETVAVTPKDAETVAVTPKDAETVAVTAKDAETVAVMEKDAETVAVMEKDAETVAVMEKDAETVAVTEKDAETVAVTEKDAETVAVTEKDAETVALTAKDAETVAVPEKDAKTVSQHSSQDYKISQTRLPITTDITMLSTPKSLLLAISGHTINSTETLLHKEETSESANVDTLTLAAGDNIPDIFFDMPDNMFVTPSNRPVSTSPLAGVLASTRSLGKTNKIIATHTDLMRVIQQTLNSANNSILPPIVATSSKVFGQKYIITSLPYLGTSNDSRFSLKVKDTSRLGTSPTSSAAVYSSIPTISYSGLITKQPLLLNMSPRSSYKPDRQTSVTEEVKPRTTFAKYISTLAPHVKTGKHSDLTTGSVTPDYTSYLGSSSKGLDSTPKLLKSQAWSTLKESPLKRTSSNIMTSATLSFSGHASDFHTPTLSPSPWPSVTVSSMKFASSTSSKLYNAGTKETKQFSTQMSSISDHLTRLHNTISVASTQITGQTKVYPGTLLGHSTFSYSMSHKVSSLLPDSNTAVSFIAKTLKPDTDSNNLTNTMTGITSTDPTVSLGGESVTGDMSFTATKNKESFNFTSSLATTESSTMFTQMFPISQNSTTTEKPTKQKWTSHTSHSTQDSARTETSAHVDWKAQTTPDSFTTPSYTFSVTGSFFDFAPDNDVTDITPNEWQSVSSAEGTQFGTVHIGFRDVKHHRQPTTPTPLTLTKSSTTSDKFSAMPLTSIPLTEKNTPVLKTISTVQRSPTTLPSKEKPRQIQDTTGCDFHGPQTAKPTIKTETLHPTRFSHITTSGSSLTFAKRAEPVSESELGTTAPSTVPRSLNFRLTSILYSNQLANVTSDEYKSLEREVKLVMNKIFTSAFPKEYIEFLIARFLNGSVQVEAYVLFDYQSPAPSSSDIVRAVVTDVLDRPSNFFRWNIELPTVESHGYTINNLEPESFPVSFLALRLGYIARSQTIVDSKQFLENLRQEIIKCVGATFPVGNFSISYVRDLRGDLEVRGNLYLNSKTNTDVQSLLQTLVTLGNKSVDLSSMTVDGYHMVLRVFPLSFQITNRQFVINMLDLSSSEFQDLSEELSAVVLSALSYTNPLQVIIREIMRGSLLFKGEVVYQLPAPGSREVLRAFLSSLSSDGILGSSSFKVDANSVQIGDSSPGPHFEYPSFPGFGVAIIVMCGLCILIFPILAIVCFKTKMLGHRKMATIQRRPDLDRQSRHFEMDNQAFRASIEQP